MAVIVRQLQFSWKDLDALLKGRNTVYLERLATGDRYQVLQYDPVEDAVWLLNPAGRKLGKTRLRQTEKDLYKVTL